MPPETGERRHPAGGFATAPVGGYISDRVGRRSLLVFFGVSGVLFTWVLFFVLPGVTNGFLAFAILTVGFVILTGYNSINAVVKAVMFPTHIRALGGGVGYAAANSCFRGTAPVFYPAAKGSGYVTLFVAYVTALIAASLVVYLFLLRNHGANWLDAPEEMRRRKESKAHRAFPTGV